MPAARNEQPNDKKLFEIFDEEDDCRRDKCRAQWTSRNKSNFKMMRCAHNMIDQKQELRLQEIKFLLAEDKSLKKKRRPAQKTDEGGRQVEGEETASATSRRRHVCQTQGKDFGQLHAAQLQRQDDQ